MMLDGRFPIESQVGLFGVIASNSAKLAKVDFEGFTFSTVEVDAILSIPISNTNQDDILIWRYTGSGSFYVKTAYHL